MGKRDCLDGFSANSYKRCEEAKGYATGRLPSKRGPMPRDADTKSRTARKLRSKAGSAIYAQR